jgi:hypothetical protein
LINNILNKLNSVRVNNEKLNKKWFKKICSKLRQSTHQFPIFF